MLCRGKRGRCYKALWTNGTGFMLGCLELLTEQPCLCAALDFRALHWKCFLQGL